MFVTACEEASNWEKVEPGIEYSEKLHEYTSPLNWTTHAKPNVHLQGQMWQNKGAIYYALYNLFSFYLYSAKLQQLSSQGT